MLRYCFVANEWQLYGVLGYHLSKLSRANYRNSHQRCSMKRCLKLCQSPFLIKGLCNFIINEILAQLFSCEFCEIFKNTLFAEHLRTTASRIIQLYWEPPSIFHLRITFVAFEKDRSKNSIICDVLFAVLSVFTIFLSWLIFCF